MTSNLNHIGKLQLGDVDHDIAPEEPENIQEFDLEQDQIECKIRKQQDIQKEHIRSQQEFLKRNSRKSK